MERLSQNVKIVLGFIETKNNGSPTLLNAYVDTAGWDGIMWIFAVGVMDAGLTGKIQECDTSGGSYGDVAGAAITAFTNADDGKISVIDIRKTGASMRYQKPVCVAGNAGAGAAMAVLAILYKGEINPATAALAGLAERVLI